MKLDRLAVIVFTMVGLVAIGGIAIMLQDTPSLPTIDPGQAYLRPDLKLTDVQVAHPAEPRLDITTISLPPIKNIKKRIGSPPTKEDVNVSMDELWFGRYARQISQWEDELPLHLMEDNDQLSGFILTMPRTPCEGGYHIKLLWIDSEGIYDWPLTNNQAHPAGAMVTMRSEFQGTIPGDTVQVIAIVYCGEEPDLGDLPLLFSDSDADDLAEFFGLLEDAKQEAHISSFITESQ